MPWDLLLDADPSRARIESYLTEQLTRIAKHDDAVIGVYVLAAHDATTFELMNIAVAEAYQGTGLGRRLLGHAIGLAESKARASSTSAPAIRVSPRCGFISAGLSDRRRRAGITSSTNYPEPIVEDGLPVST